MKLFRNIAIIILLLAAVGYGIYQWRADQTVSDIANYQLSAAQRGDLTTIIGATGIVSSNQSTVLAWQTSGIVDEVLVSTGQAVRSNQELATLKQTSLPQNLILAKAELGNAQKTLEDLPVNAELAKVKAMQDIVTFEKAVRNAQYTLDNFTVPSEQIGLTAVEAVEKFKVELDEARLAFEPYKYYPSSDPTREDLKDRLGEAQSRYDAAVKRLNYEFNLEVAEASLSKAQQDYHKWENGPDPRDVAAIQASIDAAQAALDLAHLTSPFAGTITGVNIKPGDKVNPGSIAFQVDDLSHLLVEVSVSEIDINQIKLGQEANLSFDAILSKIYRGIVVGVDRVGTSRQGVVDFIVTVELNDIDESVKPGMTAAVNIVVNELKDVLLVPNRAVRVENDQRIVYILQDNVLTQVAIQLGASSESLSEVVGGDLKVGDMIILNPPSDLGSGPPPFVRDL